MKRSNNIIRMLLPALGAALLLSGAGAAEKPQQEGHRMDVAAIYFPSWHRDDHYSAWFGEGWNEWPLLRDAKPRFPGHNILQPAWGYFDEADPKMMEKQIDTAVDAGIDVFIFDWYWYSGVQFIQRPVEEALPKARNRNRMKYALMWANHTWQDFFPVPYSGPTHVLLPIRHSAEDFARVIDHCIRRHFNQPNYWKMDGGPYFSVFAPSDLIHQLGGPEKTRKVFDDAREQVRRAGLGRLHLAAFSGSPENTPLYKQAGFDSQTGYNVTSMSTSLRLPEQPLVPYDDLIRTSERHWKDMDAGGLPYAPVATVGWDVSPRWEKDIPWPPERNGYPYTPIVTDNTPEKFGEMLRAAKRQHEGAKNPAPFILINAWNEWTEGSALLPDTQYGTGYLDQVKAVFPPEPARRMP